MSLARGQRANKPPALPEGLKIAYEAGIKRDDNSDNNDNNNNAYVSETGITRFSYCASTVPAPYPPPGRISGLTHARALAPERTIYRGARARVRAQDGANRVVRVPA